MVTAYGSSVISMAGSGSPVVLCCSPHSCCPSDRDRNKANFAICVFDCSCCFTLMYMWVFFFIVPVQIFTYPKNLLPSHSLILTRIFYNFSLPLSGFCSSDSEGHFDTPEEATPVRSIPDFPGELEDGKDPERTGKPDRNQAFSDGISINHLFGFVLN